jgi:hypothetical protein
MAQGAHAGGGWAERVEALARLVPGLGRYQDREGLRDTDKQVRTHLADQLAALGRILEEAQALLAEGKRLERLPALDRLGRRLATLTDQIRFASYGFAGVFDLRKIRETELSALHRFDLGLLEAVPRLRESLQAVADVAELEAGFPEAVAAACAALEAFRQTLEERERLARGL